MKKIEDGHRLQALNLFMDKCNTDLLTKEELITGIKSITGIKTITVEAEELYTDALEIIYTNRKVSND